MKLYNGLSPNGLRVTIFLDEKGISVPVEPINILEGDTQKDEFLRLNSLGEVPVLQLDNGSVITESVAICRYFEFLQPNTPLFGNDASSQALVEMWNRRIELKLFNVIGDVGRHEFEYFRSRGQIPEFAEFQREVFADRLTWLNQELSDNRNFLAGDQFSIVDITGMAMLVLCAFANYEIPESLPFVMRWSESMKARKSWPQLPQ